MSFKKFTIGSEKTSAAMNPVRNLTVVFYTDLQHRFIVTSISQSG